VCPVCKKAGIPVKNTTVRHLVHNKLADQVGNKDYYLCSSEACDIVYFQPESDVRFLQYQVKVPVWFKKGADPKYICYCSKVTEEAIMDAVIDYNAKTIKDIIKLTGTMQNCKCEVENPTGKCCAPVVQQTIKKALEAK